MKAKVAYNYGWTDDYISSMPYKVFKEYWLALTPIEAERQMMQIEASCSPNMKKENRKEMLSRYKRMISSMIDRSDGRLATVKDLAKAFARMTNNG